MQILRQSTGWCRRGWAVALGVCATAALPPFYLIPLLVPAFAGLFLLVDAAPTRRQAFLDGWWWGLGHFVAGLYWMCISLYVAPEKFAWLTPFALFGVPSVIAIYIGLVTLLLFGMRAQRPLRKIVIFAALWVIAEYARAHLFTGFPWNLIGYSWSVSDISIQPASIIGIYGLSWLTVLLATLPALFALSVRPWPGITAGASLLIGALLFGIWHLNVAPTQYTDIKLRIVQANIPQSLKWDPKEELSNLRKHIELTQSPGAKNIRLVIWPEAAIPYFIEPHSELVQTLAGILSPNAMLISGGLRGKGDAAHWEAWNTLFAINHEGELVGQYDKHHLVPFGEYVPFRHILPLENIAGGIGDFSSGAGPQTLTISPYPAFSPLICYEGIFPDESTDGTGKAQWLLNITNDGWFGVSSGPYQHAQMARMRAVEQGLPMVRAAGGGVSAVFDAQGRMLAYLPLNQRGILDSYLPKMAAEPVIYSRYPYAAFLLMIAASIVMGLLPQKMKKS